MAKKRKNLVFDENVLKYAARRMKEVNRKSFTNYLENLILEDYKSYKGNED